MRGVSTRKGTAISAPATSTRRTPAARTSHFRVRRMREAILRELPGLDRRQLPRACADGPGEGPVLRESIGNRGRAGDHTPRGVHHVVEQRRDDRHRDVVVATLLPRLRHLGPLDLDALEPVDVSPLFQLLDLPRDTLEEL